MHVSFFTHAELKRFRANLNDRDRLIFDIGIQTGLRITDIIKLKRTVLKRQSVRVREQKTGKIRYVYFRKALKADLDNYVKFNKSDVYIFEGRNPDKHITRQAVWKNFKKAASAVGIKRNIGTHSMRKTYAREYIRNHKLTELQKRLNHAKVYDSIIYIIDPKEIGK